MVEIGFTVRLNMKLAIFFPCLFYVMWCNVIFYKQFTMPTGKCQKIQTLLLFHSRKHFALFDWGMRDKGYFKNHFKS